MDGVNIWVRGCGLEARNPFRKFIHDKKDPNSDVTYLIDLEPSDANVMKSFLIDLITYQSTYVE